MRKIAILLAAFLFIAFIGVLSAAEEQAESVETQAATCKTSMVDKVGDWFATLGKTAEEKEKILQERLDERKAGEAVKEVEAYKEKVQSEVQKAQAKAAEEIAKAKEKADRIKEQAGEKADKEFAIAKEKAGKEVAQAKAKVAKEVESYKEKLKKDADGCLGKAKGLLKDWK